MPISIRADLFWVFPDQDPEQIVPAIRDFVKQRKFLERMIDGVRYRLDHISWSAQSGFFCGTIYKARHLNLPSKISGRQVSPLDLDDTTDLGEPMCFAYCPSVSAAAIHFSTTGPRHGKLANFLNEIGFEYAISMPPILNQDALERLNRSRIIRKASFKLDSPQNVQELRAVGDSVGGALTIAREMGGFTVEVIVSMGHESGSLNLQSIKNSFGRLLEFGDTVAKLEVMAAPNEDEAIAPINLIADRIFERIDVNDDGRELDKEHCCSGLRQTLNQYRSEINRQLSQR